MKRACPNCNQKAVSAIAVTIWMARCKRCGAVVGTDQVKSWIFSVALGVLAILAAYLAWPNYGLSAFAIAFLVYVVGLILVDVFSPLVVRGKTKNDY